MNYGYKFPNKEIHDFLVELLKENGFIGAYEYFSSVDYSIMTAEPHGKVANEYNSGFGGQIVDLETFIGHILNDEEPLEVEGMPVEFVSDGIKVGCQTINEDTCIKIIERMTPLKTNQALPINIDVESETVEVDGYVVDFELARKIFDKVNK